MRFLERLGDVIHVGLRAEEQVCSNDTPRSRQVFSQFGHLTLP